MELQSVFDSFIKHGQYLRSWSPRTVAIYRAAFVSFNRCYPGGLSEPSKIQLNGWIAWMREHNLSPGGCNVNIRSMNSFLSWLHEEGYMTVRLRARTLPRPAEPLPTFTDDEIRGLVAHKPRNRYQARAWTLTLVLLDTGIRIDEALTLEWASVDFDNRTMSVLGKGNKRRVVPFSPELRKHLFKLWGKAHGRLVFAARAGQRLRYRNAYRDLKHVCGQAGIEGKRVHPHAFRHFFAVSAIRNGADIYRLSRILGHASIATTQLYLRSMTTEQVGQAHRSPLTTARSA